MRKLTLLGLTLLVMIGTTLPIIRAGASQKPARTKPKTHTTHEKIEIKDCKVVGDQHDTEDDVQFFTKDGSTVAIQFTEPGLMAEKSNPQFVNKYQPPPVFHLSNPPASTDKPVKHTYLVRWDPANCKQMFDVKNQEKQQKITLQSDPNDILVP